MGHRSYVLLTLGFFACGFHVSFISKHLSADLSDSNVSPTAASFAFGSISLFDITGSYLFSALADRYGKTSLLTLICPLRAVLMTAIPFLPLTDLSAIIPYACMGLVWECGTFYRRNICADLRASKLLFSVWHRVYESTDRWFYWRLTRGTHIRYDWLLRSDVDVLYCTRRDLCCFALADQ